MHIPSRRCEASLSAAVYKKKRSGAAGTYDHATWLQYDGNHIRCTNPARTLRRGSTGWVGLCHMHNAVVKRSGQYFPYLPPGPRCTQPCCKGDRQVWTIGVWTPSQRLAPTPTPEAGKPNADRDKRLRDLYRKAADTSVLMTEPDMK